MPACLLGCDTLFENRYLTVEKGEIIGHADQVRCPAVRDAIGRVAGRQLGAIEWTEARVPYFEAHAANTGWELRPDMRMG